MTTVECMLLPHRWICNSNRCFYRKSRFICYSEKNGSFNCYGFV